MARHVNLLGLLYIVFGAIGGLLAIAMLALAAGAAAMLLPGGEGRGNFAAGFTAALFVTMALMMALWGAANVWAGAALRKYAPRARLAGLVLAILNLFVLPFGTALGVYSLWVLLNNESRQLFEESIVNS